jgi:periplasmic copper chaperone A
LRTRILRGMAPIMAAALLVAACGGGSSSGIKITDAWSRNSAMVSGAGAAYMVVENTGSTADAIVGASSTIAKATEVHETYDASSMAPSESTGMGGMESPAASAAMGGGSMMGMRKIDRLDIPAGGKVELKPGGYHVMLIELTKELKVGDKIEITLKFEKAGDVKVTAEVRAQ